MDGAAMISGGVGALSSVDKTGSAGGSGIGGVTTAGGCAAISSAGETGVSGGSGLGAAVVSCGGAGAATFSATGGADEGGLRPRILERNSVSELRFDGVACSASGSGRIGSSNFSNQRRIWSRE